jgi:hypothetical protein
MTKNEIEKMTVFECVNNQKFTPVAYQMDLEHLVRDYWYEVQSTAYEHHPIQKLRKQLDGYKSELSAMDKTETEEIDNLNMNIELLKTSIANMMKHSILSIADNRVKDLVSYALQIKEGEQLKRIQQKMEQIKTGDIKTHLKTIEQLKTVYNFNDSDLMKISCWLTQVKRTAYNMELEAPTALVFYSPKKCTGKSTFMTTIKKVILSSYQETVHLKNFSLEKLFSRFKPVELIHDLVISIDEIGWLTKDITAEFKSLITDNNEIEIEKKFKDPIYGRKLSNFIITSNDEPSDLFYTDAHERRLSIIDNFEKIKNVSEKQLFRMIDGIWKSAPLDYAYDTNILMAMNMERISSNDDIFEALTDLYKRHGESRQFDRPYFTVAGFYHMCREDLHIEINKRKIKSYFETSPTYFQRMQSGKVVRYKPSQKLYDDILSEESESGKI